MSSDAFVAGASFLIGDGSDPEVFTELEEVTDIPEFDSAHDLVAVTHFGSGKHKEFAPGLMEGDELAIVCNYVVGATQQAYLKSRKGKKENIRIVVTDGTGTDTFGCEVLVLSAKPGLSLEDRNVITYRLKINSEVVAV